MGLKLKASLNMHMLEVECVECVVPAETRQHCHYIWQYKGVLNILCHQVRLHVAYSYQISDKDVDIENDLRLIIFKSVKTLAI